MLRIAVCDDDVSMGEYLKQLIVCRLSSKESNYKVSVFSSGKELLDANISFDIFFLDVELKDINGIDMARRLRKESGAVIVFVTALKEYVFDAFDVQAFQYLLKPIDEEKFFQVLDRALIECHTMKKAEPLVIRVSGSYRNIQKDSILYAENEGRKIVLHLKDQQVAYYARMSELEELLGKQFFRCHRGYLVNLNEIQSYDVGNIRLKNGENILMAKQKYSDFITAYMDFLRRE